MKSVTSVGTGSTYQARSARPGEGALVLVFTGHYIALGLARSLGRHSIPVWVATDKPALVRFSRYTQRLLPWPSGPEERQAQYLLDLANRHGLDGWTIYPTSDMLVAMLARHHHALSGRFRLITPPWDEVRWAYDKRLTYDLAQRVGLDCPETHYPGNREEVEALRCRFPVILKPSVKEGSNPFTEDKAWQVEDHQTLLERYDRATGLVDPVTIMVQELIPGGGESRFAFAALCANGQPLASLVSRHPRQYPLDFARFSTYAETVDQPDVEEQARRLLSASGYTGLVQVQFKRDPRDGRYKLLDVNPRPWGSHTLSQGAGVDFPYLQWRLIHGQPVEEVRARPGVRWRRAIVDVPAALAEIRRGTLSPRAYLDSLRGPTSRSTFAADDPVPGLMEIPFWFYQRWYRRRWKPQTV